MFYLIIGAVTVVDYGESWMNRSATCMLPSLWPHIRRLRRVANREGPFYVMIAKLGSDFLRRIFTGWLPIESWHFMHFSPSCWNILLLLNLPPFLNKWAAMGTVLLFSTQPLLWVTPSLIQRIFLHGFFPGEYCSGFQMVDATLPNPSARTLFELVNIPALPCARLVAEWDERNPKQGCCLEQCSDSCGEPVRDDCFQPLIDRSSKI